MEIDDEEHQRNLPIQGEKSLRLGLLLVSAVFIFGASLLVYTGVVIEKPLEVKNSNSNSSPSGGTGLSTLSILTVGILAIIIGLGVFGFLREAYKHASKPPSGRESSSKGSESTDSGGEGWEEAPRKDDYEGSATTE